MSTPPTLLDRLRAARQTWARLSGEIEVCIRRPTDFDLATHHDRDGADWLRECLCDWRGVRELDIVPGGSGKAAPFDADVAVEWLKDRPADFAAAFDALNAAVKAHAKAKGDAAKK